MDSDLISLRVVIAGRVQGVGYRAWTVRKASEACVAGWVRNRRDGTVEAVFNGDKNKVSAMIEACKKGPMMARVDRIETFAHAGPLESGAFTARPTE